MWDSYPSMDLKIHEDVQGNVFVKASEFSKRTRGVDLFLGECAVNKKGDADYLVPSH